MSKATHYGECQVCGRKQKLPNGKLSKHGYTRRWHFFEGVCWGAEHLPFEQEKTLAEQAVERADFQAANLDELAAKCLKNTTNEDVPMELFDNSNRRFRFSNYVTRYGKIVETTKKIRDDYSYKVLTFHYEVEGVEMTESLNRHASFMGSTLDEAVRYLWKQQAERYTRSAEQIRTFIAWQRERVSKWQPKELTPVDKS